MSDLSCVISSGTVSVSTSSSGAPRTSSVSIDDAATQIAHAFAVKRASVTTSPSSASSIRTRSPQSGFVPSCETVGAGERAAVPRVLEMIEDRRTVRPAHHYSTAPRTPAAR